jgi:hypothetical protein
VHDGVVHRAKPTNPAAGSWHAIPELPSELQELPEAVWEKIRMRAEEMGCLVQVERWKKG